ncbi:MAG: SpoIIE family protein phosphatase [Nocardioidaceae bacterium]
MRTARVATRLNLYVAALLVATFIAVATALLLDVGPPGSPSWGALPLLAIALVVAGHLRVRFRRGDDVDAITLFEAVLAPLIFTFPTLAVVATVMAVQVVTGLLRRAPAVKSLFNLAQWSLAAAVGSLVLDSLRSDPGVTGRTLAQTVLALAAVGLVNNTALTVVLAISGDKPVASVLRELRPILVPGWLVGWAVNTLIGLLFVMAYATSSLAVVLFPVPLLILHLAYRGYATARSDRFRLYGVRKAAQTLAAPLHHRDAIGDFLSDVRRGFESGGALLVLVSESGELELHRLDHDGYVASEDTRTVSDSVAAVLADELAPSSSTSGDSGNVGRLLHAEGWRDCISAPLIDEHRRLGALAVFDRTGLEGDTVADLAMLETLARETAHTIARGRLFEGVLEERRKLNLIVDTTSDGIFTLADDGTVLTWNSGCEAITGLAARDTVDRPYILTGLRARTAAGVPIDFAGWATNPTLPGEVVITRPDGSHRRLSCSVSTATATDLQTRTLVVVARDITPAEEYQELREQFSRLVEAQAAQRLVVEHLQRAVAPEPPGIDGGDIAVAYVASDAASPTGGDLFDWHLLPTGELHIAVVDLLGHGVEATRHALLVVHALRFAAVDGTPLDQIVTRADELLTAQQSDLVATVVIARYRPETGELQVVSGGHPPALVVSAEGGVTQLAAWGGAIGWPGVGSDNIVTTVLQPNESLVLYTDGLIEARKNVIDGMDALVRHASDVASLPAAQFADELVRRSLEGAYRRDDSLALVLRRTRVAAVPDRMSWDVEPGSQAAIHNARQGLKSWLAEHRSTADDAVLVAAELLANAVVVARSSVVLSATLEGDQVVVEVSDDGHGDSHLDELGERLPRSESEHGRGLFLVRALSDDVSMLSTDEGTVVTCVLPTARARLSGRRQRTSRGG